VGHETVAGQPCTILDHVGKDGHFRMWLSDKYEIPMRFVYFEHAKPAFSYTVNDLSLSVNLPASAFSVPAGYEVTDISDVLNGMDEKHKH
jgi:outer membrane lipoprotein-sorting protein